MKILQRLGVGLVAASMLILVVAVQIEANHGDPHGPPPPRPPTSTPPGLIRTPPPVVATPVSATPVPTVFDSSQIDTDGDGCTDLAETQTAEGTEVYGGLRDFQNFWDFYQVPTGEPPVRDAVVSIADIGAVVARFGATGDPTGDPLASAPLAPSYHTAFDRGGVIDGQNVWNLLPPDGSISIGDLGAVVAQFGHTCAATP